MIFKFSGYLVFKYVVLGFINSLWMELVKIDIYVMVVNLGFI